MEGKRGPRLSTNLLCGLGEVPFLSLSFLFISHGASQSTLHSLGPELAEVVIRNPWGLPWQLVCPPGVLGGWEELGNTVKTCGAAPLCGGLVQSRSYTRWVSRPAEWTGCSLARQQASASSVPEPVSPRLGPLVWPAGVPTSADVGSQAENPSSNGFWWEPEESGVEEAAAEARAAACACFRPACSLVFTDHTGASLGRALRSHPHPPLPLPRDCDPFPSRDLSSPRRPLHPPDSGVSGPVGRRRRLHLAAHSAIPPTRSNQHSQLCASRGRSSGRWS